MTLIGLRASGSNMPTSAASIARSAKAICPLCHDKTALIVYALSVHDSPAP
jgi:hypothetical protein